MNASEYNFFIHVKEDIVMARKFYKGAKAGCIGHTASGVPIRDYFIVKMVTDAGKSRFFQLQEQYGISFCGEWMKITPTTKMVMLNEEGDWYPKLVWKLNNGKEFEPKDLELRYVIIEITDLMQEIAKLYCTEKFMDSPYVKMKDCVGICYSTDELSRKNADDKFIIESVEKYIKKRNEEKKYYREMIKEFEKNMKENKKED